VRAGAALHIPAAGLAGLIVRSGPARATARVDQPPPALPLGPAGRNQMAAWPAPVLLTLSSAYSRDSAHWVPQGSRSAKPDVGQMLPDPGHSRSSRIHMLDLAGPLRRAGAAANACSAMS
jgi:hypothetical protein